MRWTFLAVTSIAVLLDTNGAFARETLVPEGTAGYFTEVKNGPKVSNPVVINSQLEREFA